MGTFSIWHWLIVLVVVVLVFGGKKLGDAGYHVGRAVHDFKKSMREGGKSEDAGKDKPALNSDNATASAAASATENSGTAEKSAS